MAPCKQEGCLCIDPFASSEEIALSIDEGRPLSAEVKLKRAEKVQQRGYAQFRAGKWPACHLSVSFSSFLSLNQFDTCN